MSFAFLTTGTDSVPSYQRTVFGPQGTFRESGEDLYYSTLAKDSDLPFSAAGTGIARIGGAVAHLSRAFQVGSAVDVTG